MATGLRSRSPEGQERKPLFGPGSDNPDDSGGNRNDGHNQRATGPMPADMPADPFADEEAAGDASDPRGEGPDKVATPSDIRKQEESAGGSSDDQEPKKQKDDDDDDESGLYTGEDDGGGRKRKVKYKKRIVLGTGVAGGIIAATFAGLTFVQGPLEFIHIAKLLDKFHFNALQDDQDGRLTRIARYIHDPSKPQNTRLGIVGNSIADKLEARIYDKTGLKPNFDTTNARFLGYGVDRKHEKYQSMSYEDIKNSIAAEYGIEKSTIKVKNGALTFDPDTTRFNAVKGYRQEVKFSSALLVNAGLSKKSSYIGARVLAERNDWTFHPIQKLDAKIQDAALKQGKKGIDKLRDEYRKAKMEIEIKGYTAPLGGEPSSQKDANGNTQPSAEEAAQSAREIKEEATKIDPADPESEKKFRDSINAKIDTKVKAGAAGSAGLLGIACVIKSVSENYEQTKVQASKQMEKKANDSITTGSQAQSNQDISMLQLGFRKEQLDEEDSKGKVISTWNQGRSWQYLMNHDATGPDLPEEGKVFDKSNKAGFLDDIPGLGTACGILGSAPGQIFAFVTGPVNFLIGETVVKQGVGLISHWLSRAPVAVAAAGADFGNYINYGARLASNSMAATFGGVLMSTAQELTINSVENELDQEDFQTHNIAYRLFNPYDERTLASRLIDTHSNAAPTQQVASLAQGFGGIFTSALSTPASLLSGVTHAANTTYDWNGLKKIGFTADEMQDSRFENPFLNGCYVVGCHDSSRNVTGIFEDPDKANKYAERAKDCFNVGIINDGSSWSIDSATAAFDINSMGYDDSSECLDKDTEWLRVRFWLLDTGTIQGYDCTTNSTTSEESCENLGFKGDASGGGGSGGDGSSSGSTVAGDGTVATGSVGELAKKLLAYKATGEYRCDNGGDCTDLQKLVDGRPLAGSDGCRADKLDPRVLQLLLYAIENGNFKVGTFAFCGDHHFDSLKGHSGGFAVDISSVNGVAINQYTDKARRETLALNKFLNGVPAQLKIRQQISWGYGEHHDADIAATQQANGRICGVGCVSFYNLATEQQHMNHIHAGF